MANCKTVFLGTERSQTDKVELQTYVNANNEIFIEIVESDTNGSYEIHHICLDKSTAIKFAKTIRAEINKMQY